MRLGPRSAAGAIVAVVALGAAWANAQRADPRTPGTFEVGAPRGPSPTERVTNQRTGLSPTALPASGLRVEWRKSLGIPIEHAPVVRHDGTVAVLTSRGDVYVYDDAGDEKWRVTTGLSASSGPALLSDGTIAFATPGAELVGARAGQRRFQVRLPGDRPARITPIATDDGGLVLALAAEVLFVDAEGQARARAALPEPLAAGLVATGGRVYGAAASGAVYAISAGHEATRVGGFGGAIDRGMAAASPRTLLAVVDTSRLVELDVATGVAQVRATAPLGQLLGPPAVHASIAYVTSYLPGRVYVVGYDAAGAERRRAQIATFVPPISLDGGATSLPVPPHAGLVLDTSGTIAFVTPDGTAGVSTDQGGVDTVGDVACARALGRAASAAGGIAPAGPGAFYVACEGGQLVKIVGK